MAVKREIQASVKDERLVEKRRNQMIRGAVSLFKEKGFHRTTTREIARAAGFSIGTLYEYIRTKEDVLFLVCDSIYEQVRKRLSSMDLEEGTLESLKLGIDHYFRIVDEMQDEVLVMYQEAKVLSNEALPYVLKRELEMVGMFEKLIKRCVENGELEISQEHQQLLAHNIFVQGQMWGFRRWALQKTCSIEDYIRLQTDLLFSGIKGFKAQVEVGG
ncbi:TetR/AcrR family transcriptional regulator [Siminovitchia acidinfaciens]|uniref:TetR/AcrR family transcriptional regulator n=1 Tax=Siminovitchia acidinfaciens TaxID=2321395 RepID=A0A429Y6H0_9BACI|nr:TetR/AcrR family transcriptional regulator [Siminovitchia acidinfaciens]RST77047.1 TetR/AcrR family transcriptional regulator [Siminovitchia acidinfaciens]VEF46437.1 TetR family transcriptional regulator [Bacillus freudenreichii]